MTPSNETKLECIEMRMEYIMSKTGYENHPNWKYLIAAQKTLIERINNKKQ